ncbi:MAG: hypothetical protein JXR40_07175 [Pontiellaceae bacterium]|nr:hypothetical protein [Pontiellaceae bacterium]
MKNGETRRIIPESIAAWAVLSILFIFELSVLFGGLEIKGTTVARVAPWAYSLYSRLVGEHPDQIASRLEWDFFDEEEVIEALTTDAQEAPIFLLSPNEEFPAVQTNAFDWPNLTEEDFDVVWPDLTPTNSEPIEDFLIEEPLVEQPMIEHLPVAELPAEVSPIDEPVVEEPPVEESPMDEPVVEEPPEREVIPVG